MATVDQNQQEAVEQESVKIERNTKGYNWSVRVIRRPGESDDDLLDRLSAMNDRLRAEYGGG